uniref:Acylglycerol kinase, mitochondrial n=1 Tax=Sinocyclocheilus grahami TaxID=75366 RepID=A0A672MRU3_SINGR
SYGGHWLYGKHRFVLSYLTAFGHQLIGPQEHLKKATVILNPAACKGKANRLFEKNAAPILHLAGMEVKIVKVVLIARFPEVQKYLHKMGLLKNDNLNIFKCFYETFSKIPIAFIPLGCSNSLSQSLHLVSNNKVQHITLATLSILKGETVPLDVLQIKSEKEQPVFALLGLHWGAFRDVACSISNYWYLGPLKTRAAHWFSSLKQWPQTSLSYLAPVPRPPDLPTEIPPRPNLLYHIYRRLKNYWNPPIQEPLQDPEPERWENKDISTLELTVSTHNKNPVKRREADSMLITLDPDSLTAGQFITEGTKKALNPMESVENALQIEDSAACLSPPEVSIFFGKALGTDFFVIIH